MSTPPESVQIPNRQNRRRTGASACHEYLWGRPPGLQATSRSRRFLFVTQAVSRAMSMLWVGLQKACARPFRSRRSLFVGRRFRLPSDDHPNMTTPITSRILKALAILTLILIVSITIGLAVGSQRIHPSALFTDSFSRTLFLRLRLPRVLMAVVIGASLAVTGGALQALFRNPLADPYTLGVSRREGRSAPASPSLSDGARASSRFPWSSSPHS